MAAADPILDHYAQFDESSRLSGAFGEFECARTRALIARYLPAAPADIIDVDPIQRSGSSISSEA